MLPLMIMQFAFEGTVAGIAAMWRRWRGLPPPKQPVEAEERLPRPLRLGFYGGIVAGALYGFSRYWATADTSVASAVL